MWTAALAVLVAGCLVVGPGLAVARALPGRAAFVQDVALAPAVTLALVWNTGTLLKLVRAPVSATSVLTGMALITVTALAAVGLRRRRSPRAPSQLPVDRWDAGGLILAVMTGAALWLMGTAWLSAVPPNDDGTHHGLFVARLVATHGLDLAQVANGLNPPTGGTSFYPMAMHLAASLLVAPFGSVGIALNAVWVVVAVVAFPVGFYVLVRRTFPRAGRAGLAAAWVSVLLPQFPAQPTYWGGIALICGLCVVPALVDRGLAVFLDPPTSPGARLGAGIVLGLAATGLAFTHTGELFTAGLLGLCLLAGLAGRSVTRLRWRSLLPVVGVGVALLAVSMAPWILDLAAVGGNRTLGLTLAPVDLSQVLLFLATDLFGPPDVLFLMLLLVGAGVVTSLRQRAARGWLAYTAVFVLFAVAASGRWPGVVRLTSPWYVEVYRLGFNLVLPCVAFAGVGLWWFVSTLARKLSPAPFRDARLSTGVPAVLACLILALPALLWLGVDTLGVARGNFVGDPPGDGGSLDTADAQASWAWLASHNAPGDRVLNEFVDGSGWMYADAGLAPVLPTKVAPPFTDDRPYLVEHADEISSDPRVLEIARRYGVRYAYLGDRIFPGHEKLPVPRLPPVAQMLAGGWRVVFRTPTTVVLETPSGT